MASSTSGWAPDFFFGESLATESGRRWPNRGVVKVVKQEGPAGPSGLSQAKSSTSKWDVHV